MDASPFLTQRITDKFDNSVFSLCLWFLKRPDKKKVKLIKYKVNEIISIKINIKNI